MLCAPLPSPTMGGKWKSQGKHAPALAARDVDVLVTAKQTAQEILLSIPKLLAGLPVWMQLSIYAVIAVLMFMAFRDKRIAFYSVAFGFLGAGTGLAIGFVADVASGGRDHFAALGIALGALLGIGLGALYHLESGSRGSKGGSGPPSAARRQTPAGGRAGLQPRPPAPGGRGKGGKGDYMGAGKAGWDKMGWTGALGGTDRAPTGPRARKLPA